MINEFKGEYRFLSNFYACDIELDGVIYPTVEHAYQAAKTLDPEYRKLFADRKLAPGGAKRMGKQVPLRPDWDSIKLGIMESLVRQKFDTHLALQLIETGDQQLVESNWWGDTFWGVCEGVGENHLGKILMKVRKELQEEL